MSDRKPPVDQHDKKADGSTEPPANQGGTGIGGGLVGLAIGGLLGRRVGGVSGAVVGAVAGALVGKGTAQRVNRTVEAVVDSAKSVTEGVNHSVEAVVDSAKSVTEGVNHSVKGVGDALKDTVEEVKPSVVGVVDAVKNIAVDAKSSVIGVVDAIKDTIDEVKPSVVATAQSVNHSVKDVGDAVSDTVNAVKPVVGDVVDAIKNIVVDANPSVVSPVEAINTVEEVKPSVVATAQSVNHSAKVEDTVEEVSAAKPHNTKREQNPNREPQRKPSPQHFTTSSQEHPRSHDLPEQPLQRVKPLQQSEPFKELDIKPKQPPQAVRPLQQSEPFKKLDIKPIEYKNIRQKQENTQQPTQQTPQLQIGKIPILAGILMGAVTITWIGLTGALSSQEALLATNLPKFKPTLNSLPKIPKITADGWIFIGDLNNALASKSGRKSLTKASQSTSSSIVPSVGSIVTVTAKRGVILRKNRPQKPNFNYQKQKALTTLKAGEKLKILKVESLTPNTPNPVTKVWVAVDRCGKACN